MCRLLNCVGAQPWGIKTVQPANTIDLTGASHDSGCSQSHPPSMMAHIVSVLLLWIFAPILWICLCPSCKELFFPNLLQVLAMYDNVLQRSCQLYVFLVCKQPCIKVLLFFGGKVFHGRLFSHCLPAAPRAFSFLSFIGVSCSPPLWWECASYPSIFHSNCVFFRFF